MIANSAPEWKITKRLMQNYLDSEKTYQNEKNNKPKINTSKHQTNIIDKFLCNQYKRCKFFLSTKDDIAITESDRGHKSIICKKTTLLKKRDDFVS